MLYVFKTTEMQSRLVRLEQVGEAELKRALTAAGIWEARFGWRADPSGRLVHVSGPGRYLELVEQTAQVLEQQYTLRSEKTGDLSVEIFPLRYAVAEDRKIEYRDDEIEAPGIASILSRVLSDANVVAVGDEPGKLRPGPQSSHAVVQAEPSLNAVVVRDHRDRLPMYRRLIEALDRPSARIEVGLSIIDINAENLAQLGVDWSAGFAWATTSRSRSAPPARIARRAAAPVAGRSAAWWTVAGWISCWPRSPCCRARDRRRSDPGRPC